MFYPAKEFKKALARRAVDNIFRIVEQSKLLNTDSTVFIDLFNTGIVVNLSRLAKKHYPKIAPLIRGIIEKEIKKL
jgi:hypothetical protein